MMNSDRFERLSPVLALAVFACNASVAATPSAPTPVKVHTVASGPAVTVSRYSGALEATRQVTMSFRVPGYVEALGRTSEAARALDKGDFVEKGAVLARLRAAEYEHEVARARALITDARARAKLADADLQRSEQLFADSVIARAELDAQRARTESAAAAVDDAVARLYAAELALADTVLRAPMDSIVLSRHVEVGTLAAAGAPAVTLADVREVKAVFGAPQVLVEKLSIGAPLQIFVGAEGEHRAPEKLLDARVTRIAPAADASGRLFSVEALLRNPAGELRPGAVVSVRVPAIAEQSALVVPLESVVRSRREPRAFSVFVLEGQADRGRVRETEVELGEIVGNAVTVTDGLAPNQRVVTVGATLLRDGDDAIAIH